MFERFVEETKIIKPKYLTWRDVLSERETKVVKSPGDQPKSKKCSTLPH